MTKPINGLLIACLCAALSGCWPSARECYGDATIRCHVARINAAAAKMDRVIAEIKAQDQVLIAGLGEARYKRLLELLEARRQSIVDSRPNLFMRLFMDEMEWEYPGSKFSYSQERELEQILAGMQRAPAAPKQSPPTSGGQSFALEQCVEAHIKAFRREQGEDAVVRMDVLDEWTQECRTAGK